MKMCVRAAAALMIGGVAAPVLAQPWVTYDASLGTMPQDQCWTAREDIQPPMSYPVGVGPEGLHLSTLGFATSGTNGGGVWWERTDVSIDFSADFAVEIRVRIVSAPNHSVNPQAGWPRPGYALTVYDVHGRLFWVGLGSGEVFLSNTAFGQYGSANTVTTAFNTTDAPHVYRIERAAGGVGAALRIDGVLRLVLPALGPIENGGAVVYFGDPTYWANSESHTAWVRYSGVGNGPITGLTGPDNAATCPTGAATFSVAAAGTGPFTYRWQWTAPQINPGWSDVAEGGNDDVNGRPVFIATGASAPSVSVQRDPATSYTYSDFTGFGLRAVVTNACGSVTSGAATFTICHADYNCDGFVDGIDYDQFNNDFENPNPQEQIRADYNGDGFVDGIDYDQFNNDFEAGC